MQVHGKVVHEIGLNKIDSIEAIDDSFQMNDYMGCLWAYWMLSSGIRVLEEKSF